MATISGASGRRTTSGDLIRDIRQRAMSNGIDAESWFLAMTGIKARFTVPPLGKSMLIVTIFMEMAVISPMAAWGLRRTSYSPTFRSPMPAAMMEILKWRSPIQSTAIPKGMNRVNFWECWVCPSSWGTLLFWMAIYHLDKWLPGPCRQTFLKELSWTDPSTLIQTGGPIVQRGVPRLPKHPQALQDHSLGLGFQGTTHATSMEGRWLRLSNPSDERKGRPEGERYQ